MTASIASLSVWVFWAAFALVAYAYVGYPALIWCVSRRAAPRPPAPETGERPFVSVLVAAHNEEKLIGQRVANALASVYPSDRIEVVVASDGSTDRTASIVRGSSDDRVRLLEAPQRRGKASILNAAFPELRGEIVVLSDANTVMHPTAVEHLARWFVNPHIGVVCGKLVLRDPSTGNNVDSLYWRYETFLKRCEGRIGALLGANGGIYAIRRSAFEGVRRDTVVDDMVIPLLARIRTGCELVYDETAVAEEETPEDLRSEFERRSRIGAGGFQSILALRRLLNPAHGWLAFTFLSHKICRWCCPFALVAMLLASLTAPGYRWAFGLQCAAYLVAMLGQLLRGRGLLQRGIRLSTMFTMMNLALLVGFWRWLRGDLGGVWQRTAR